jgi:hypothetical protein
VDLIRPIVSWRELFGIKVTVAVAAVALHVPAYTVLSVWGFRTSGIAGVTTFEALTWGLLGGGLMATLGTAVGFLLPDFERGNPLAPGASFGGWLMFGVMALTALGVASGTRLLLVQDRISLGVFAVMVGLVFFALTSASGGLAQFAFMRLRRGESLSR